VIGMTEVAAPWGPIRIAASAEAVVALEVLSEDAAFAEGCRRRLGERPDRAEHASPAVRRRLDQAGQAIVALLAGSPADAASVPIELAGLSEWDRQVLAGVRSLAWGEVIGYGRLAERIGRRGAARAVGGSVGRNPIGLLVPCHRVIAGDGSLGGYGGGWLGEREHLLEIKEILLALEGNHPARRPA
jgi:methylated-DNA-[protein]-cysteine S-methyltransferase